MKQNAGQRKGTDSRIILESVTVLELVEWPTTTTEQSRENVKNDVPTEQVLPGPSACLAVIIIRAYVRTFGRTQSATVTTLLKTNL